jgi:acylphosphatase
MKVRAHIHVSGRVQGVFFRARIMERAVRLDVAGWVRNLPDGEVEAVFEGEERSVEALLEFCRQGPSRAVITRFNLNWEPFVGEFKDFKVRY